MASKIFVGNGELSEAGHRLLSDFRYGLAQIMESDAVKLMTENELRILGTNLVKLVNDTITNNISYHLKVEAKLNAMTDQEFEEYLLEQYGPEWRFMSLTPEELRRCPLPSQRELEEALEQGRKDMEAVRQAQGDWIDPNLNFK